MTKSARTEAGLTPPASTSAAAPTAPVPLPDWTALWDFGDPLATETRFRDLLARVDAATHPAYVLEVQTQLARTYSLRLRFDEAHALLDPIEPQVTPALATTPELRRVRIRYLLERGRTFNSAGERDRAKSLFVEAWELAGPAGEEALALDAAHMVAIAAEPGEALEWAHRALILAESSTDPKARRWLGPLTNNTGWTYLEQGEHEKALELFQKGLQFRLESGWTAETVIALYAIGVAQRRKGDLQAALRTALEVQIRWEALGQEPDGYAREELGECLLALGRPEEARPHFRRAYELLSQDAWMQQNEAARLEHLKSLGGD